MNTLFLTQCILGIAIVANILLIAFVLSRNTRPLMNKTLVVLMMGILGWSASIFINLWLESERIESFVFAFASVALIAQLYFVYLYPGNEQRPRLPLLMGTALGLGTSFVIASFIPGSVFSSIEITDAGYTIVHPGWLSNGYAVFVTIYILSAIALLVYKRFTVHEQHLREQTSYLLYGFVLFFLTNLFTNSILPVVFGIHFFNAIGPVFSVILVAFIVHVIYRYRFLDIQLIIQRGLIYTILLGLVISVYYTLVALISLLLQPTLQITVLSAGAITTFVGIITAPWIDNYLRRITNPLFFKDRYNYRETLHALSEILNTNISFRSITTKITRELETALKASFAVFSFPNTPPPPDVIVEEELNVPIKLKNGQHADLHLGKKRSGDPYTQTDRLLLKTLAHQLSTAFERARLYEELREYSRKLEERVEERTGELQEAYEQQRQMMYNISHGLQSPIAILRTELERLRAHTTNAHEMATAMKMIDTLSAVVYDFLHLAEIESRHTPDDTEELDLSEILAEIIEEVQIIAESQNIRMEHEIIGPAIVHGSRRKLKELFTTLYGNAIKYLRSDGDRVIRLTMQSDNQHVVISVSDSGVGISEEELPRIFDRFYRSPRIKHLHGTGLGLPIANAIVTQHHGTIEVDSKLMVGTTFTVRLPRRRQISNVKNT